MASSIESMDAAVKALTSRVNSLEGSEAVRALHASFVRAVADRQFDTLAGFFWPDATIDMRNHGAKQGEAAIAEHFGQMVNAPLQAASYLLSSPVISVDGDNATAKWTWHRFHKDQYPGGDDFPAHGLWEEGEYRCSYSQGVDGSWKFSSMRFRMVRPDPDEA